MMENSKTEKIVCPYIFQFILNLFIFKLFFVSENTQRISKMQKQKLVEYMSSHLEFAKAQFGGILSNTNNKEEWEIT